MNKQQKQVVDDLKKDINDLINDYASDLLSTTSTLPNARRTSINSDRVKITPKHKAAIINHAKKGKTVDFVLTKYPLYTKAQLSAVFAHVTMGTY